MRKMVVVVMLLVLMMGPLLAEDFGGRWDAMPIAERKAFFEGYLSGLWKAEVLSYQAEGESLAYTQIHLLSSSIGHRWDTFNERDYPKFLFSLMDTYYRIPENRVHNFESALEWAATVTLEEKK